MDIETEKRNNALKHLSRTIKGKKRYAFSKLGNELTLITTKKCNLNCPFCYDKANLFQIEKEMSPDQIIRLIRICKKMGVKKVRFTGGEALLKDRFMDILKECEGIFVILCSNGLILREKLPLILRMHNPKDLHIHVSMDGTETHKKYRKGSDPYDILRILKQIKKISPETEISVNTVLNKDNIYELVELYSLLKSVKPNRWTISFPRMVDNALKRDFTLPLISDTVIEFNSLIKKYYADKKPFNMSFSYFYKFELMDKATYTSPKIDLSQHPCLPDANGAKGLVIDSFGNIIDCLVLKPLKKPINLKKLLNEDNLSIAKFVSAIYGSLGTEFYNIKLKDKQECLNCRYFRLCKGGCPANAYYLRGNLHQTDIISCFMFYYFEKNILPLIDAKEQKEYRNLIDNSKSVDSINKRINNNKNIFVSLGMLPS
ncbi:MAG: radical SAM protein [Nanoarchaeota archaeon]